VKFIYLTEPLLFRILYIFAISFSLVSCGGGAKVLKDPQDIEITKPIVSAENRVITVELDWIIVSNGPGSWAKNAYWDEYLISVHNPQSQPLSITSVAVYDSKGYENVPLSNRKKLVESSKKTIRRYKESDIDVSPGMGAGQLLATGGAVTVTGVGLVYAAASTAAPYGGASTGATAVGLAGVGMVLAAPVVAVVAVKRATDNKKVNEEIKHRRSTFPFDVDAATTSRLHLFYPVVVSPSHIVISYEIDGKSHELTLNTFKELMGLHLDTLSNGSSGTIPESE
jgi:hypothetical protein